LNPTVIPHPRVLLPSRRITPIGREIPRAVPDSRVPRSRPMLP
jgi:hypothetical protein